MFKKILSNPLLSGALATSLMVFGACSSCSGAKSVKEKTPLNEQENEHALQFPGGDKADPIESAWSKKVPGRITDLNVSIDGGLILLTTAPDEGSNRHTLSLLNQRGKTLWSVEQSSPIKSQAISKDGSLAVISNYNDELIAIDGKSGKTLWSSAGNGMCRPFILSPLKKVLCYHDDDAEPRIAFDVFDWNGGKTLSFPITNDILSLKTSADETHFAMALTRSQVVLIGPELRALWQKPVGGEVIDVAVSDGPSPQVAALSNSSTGASNGGGQTLSLWDVKGKKLAQVRVPHHAIQVEFEPDGSRVAVYGNGPHGQALTTFSVTETDKTTQLTEAWTRSDPKYADYSSQMLLTGGLTIIGFEDTAAKTRHSHLLAFSGDGTLKWNIPITTEEGAYLYAKDFSPASSFLVIGTDDSVLTGYRIGR